MRRTPDEGAALVGDDLRVGEDALSAAATPLAERPFRSPDYLSDIGDAYQQVGGEVGGHSRYRTTPHSHGRFRQSGRRSPLRHNRRPVAFRDVHFPIPESGCCCGRRLALLHHGPCFVRHTTEGFGEVVEGFRLGCAVAHAAGKFLDPGREPAIVLVLSRGHGRSTTCSHGPDRLHPNSTRVGTMRRTSYTSTTLIPQRGQKITATRRTGRRASPARLA